MVYSPDWTKDVNPTDNDDDEKPVTWGDRDLDDGSNEDDND